MKISRDEDTLQGCEFILYSLKAFYISLLGEIFRNHEDFDSSPQPRGYERLSLKSKCVIMGCSCVLAKAFRFRRRDRTDTLKSVRYIYPPEKFAIFLLKLYIFQIVRDDNTNPEWMITLSDSYRYSRRESRLTKSKRPSVEEIQMLATMLSIDPANPFVQLSLAEYIIDSVRDSNGYFHCNDLLLRTSEQCMQYLRDICSKLTEKYPRNICINSSISDYFLRYVKFIDFDIDYSEKLLMKAYALDKGNPKTTHRLAIFHRMSLGDIEESFVWLDKTIRLDPYHFNATMDYVRTLMGKWDQYDVIDFMESKVW